MQISPSSTTAKNKETSPQSQNSLSKLTNSHYRSSDLTPSSSQNYGNYEPKLPFASSVKPKVDLMSTNSPSIRPYSHNKNQQATVQLRVNQEKGIFSIA